MQNPEMARSVMSQEIERLLSYDAIAFKNAKFDIDMYLKTARGMPGFQNDQRLKEAVTNLSNRILADPDFVVDVDFAGRAYLQQRFEQQYNTRVANAITDPTGETARLIGNAGIDISQYPDISAIPENVANEIKNVLYTRIVGSREMFENIQMGGRFTPQSMDNLAAVTNLFELIHEEAEMAGPDANAARRVMKLISQGSHISETDDYLTGFYAKYVQTGQLDFSPADLPHLPVGSRKKKLRAICKTHDSKIICHNHFYRRSSRAFN